MTDNIPLLDRLRNWPATGHPRKDAFSSHYVGGLLKEAADEIERLQKIIEEHKETG